MKFRNITFLQTAVFAATANLCLWTTIARAAPSAEALGPWMAYELVEGNSLPQNNVLFFDGAMYPSNGAFSVTSHSVYNSGTYWRHTQTYDAPVELGTFGYAQSHTIESMRFHRGDGSYGTNLVGLIQT